MRARFGLILALPWLAGCADLFPGPATCPAPREMSPPSERGVYELKQPTEGADFAGDPRGVLLDPLMFQEDSWAAGAMAKLQPYRAPTLGADLARGGSVLVCSFAVGPTPDIDGIDGPSGPILTISKPDLVVWADFAGQKINKGPVLWSSRAIFAFRTNLKEGDAVRFGFGDFDLFSANDPIGAVETRYPGELPFEAKGASGDAKCYAAPPAMIAAERAKWQKELSDASAAFEAYSPTIDAPIPWGPAGRVRAALGAVAYFGGRDEAAEKALVARLEEVSKRQWAAYLDLLRGKQKSAPAPGAWVSLGDKLDGRVAGLRCQVGSQLIPNCDPALEVRLKVDMEVPDCHAAPSFFEQIEPVSLINHRGDTTSPLMSDAKKNGVWVTSEADLWRAKKGDTIQIRLFGGGIFYRPSHERYDIPLVVVNGTYLRIY